MKYDVINEVINGATIEVFIIPNQASKIQDWFLESDKARLTEVCNNVASANGIEFNSDTDKLVQLWFTGFGSQNIADHGADVTAVDENGVIYTIDSRNMQFLPTALFAGHTEGEIVPMAIPAIMFTNDTDGNKQKVRTTLTVNVKLNQTGYRYRGFGNFEDVLRRVA